MLSKQFISYIFRSGSSHLISPAQSHHHIHSCPSPTVWVEGGGKTVEASKWTEMGTYCPKALIPDASASIGLIDGPVGLKMGWP